MNRGTTDRLGEWLRPFRRKSLLEKSLQQSCGAPLRQFGKAALFATFHPATKHCETA
jgi:hypothetical protein